MDRASSCASYSEEETAALTHRSTANSFNTSSVETPWSGIASGTSRDSRISVDADSHSCTDVDASSCQDEHDDYYEFLHEFAGSFDAGNEEDDLESEPGSQDGDGDRDG